MPPPDDYRLEEQVGHLLRRANQRHTALFAELFEAYELTPLQFAALMKLAEAGGPVSQNELGRLTAMDPNTIQGVVRRLIKRGLVEGTQSATDKRRTELVLSDNGRSMVDRLIQPGFAVSHATLSPLSAQEQRRLVSLLKRIT